LCCAGFLHHVEFGITVFFPHDNDGKCEQDRVQASPADSLISSRRFTSPPLQVTSTTWEASTCRVPRWVTKGAKSCPMSALCQKRTLAAAGLSRGHVRGDH